MARPQKPIDAEQVRKLAERHWTMEMIAAHFNVSGDTIKRRFKDVVDAGRQEGKAKLIDVLWQRAVIEKSDRILIHLAERILGPIIQEQKVTHYGDFKELPDEEIDRACRGEE